MTTPNVHGKDDKKSGTAQPPPPPNGNKATDNRPPAGQTGAKTKGPRTERKVYVIYLATGGGSINIVDFKSRSEAEKFLNGVDAPREFDVFVGQRIERKQRVSLR